MNEAKEEMTKEEMTKKEVPAGFSLDSCEASLTHRLMEHQGMY